MLDFDRQMNAFAIECGGIYRRYCDDIMLVLPDSNVDGVQDFVDRLASEAVVEINKEKSHTVAFLKHPATVAGEPLQYLGFNFDGSRVTLRLSSIDRYYSKMRAGVSLARQTQRKANRKEQDEGKSLSALKLEKLCRLYSYLYKRRRRKDPTREAKTIGNFLTYAYKAARVMQSDAIKKQVRSHWRKLLEEIKKPIKAQLRGP